VKKFSCSNIIVHFSAMEGLYWSIFEMIHFWYFGALLRATLTKKIFSSGKIFVSISPKVGKNSYQFFHENVLARFCLAFSRFPSSIILLGMLVLSIRNLFLLGQWEISAIGWRQILFCCFIKQSALRMSLNMYLVTSITLTY